MSCAAWSADVLIDRLSTPRSDRGCFTTVASPSKASCIASLSACSLYPCLMLSTCQGGGSSLARSPPKSPSRYARASDQAVLVYCGVAPYARLPAIRRLASIRVRLHPHQHRRPPLATLCLACRPPRQVAPPVKIIHSTGPECLASKRPLGTSRYSQSESARPVRNWLAKDPPGGPGPPRSQDACF